ncbi:MAG: murein transglycosylase A [Micavibrio sp.]
MHGKYFKPLRSSLPVLLACLLLSSCAGVTDTAKDDGAKLQLKPANFSALDGWRGEDFKDFMTAYKISCGRILKRGAGEKFASDPAFGTYGDWQAPCRAAENINAGDSAAVRGFLETHFNVAAATAGGKEEGLFTGYYVSTLRGSRSKGGAYQHPLLGRPDDLVMVDLGEFREELKGQRIAGRVQGGKLKPYESRADIVGGKMPQAQFRPIVWLDNPYDAFFVQVQGSGIVHLNDGSKMHVGYAGQNGHPYHAIGRELVKRGVYTKDEVSMDSIRRWMDQNPAQADELMNTNPSYVFFTEKTVSPDDAAGTGAVGGEGVPLTPGRSIAIDRSKIPYGIPVYLIADYGDEQNRPIRKLLMAQDTGGAIRGAVRGDYFWGAGQFAESKAGPMKAQGRYYFLLPKTIR